MVFCRLGFFILLIPVAIGVDKPVDKVESTHNNTTSAPKNLLQKEHNSTKKTFTLAAEGGNIEVSQPNPTLIKEDDAVLLPKMPSADVGEISSKNKIKHVVARTGAPVIIDSKEFLTEPPVPLQKSNIVKNVTSTSSAVSAPSLASKAPHKPEVLRYEEGSNINIGKPSGVTGEAKTQASKPGSHPGMIMPIVITILVVPLFAVLGYMALKRGKEAWNNRHYKRMDFLLDGMYND